MSDATTENFDFVGNNICLDFVNTVLDRVDNTGRDDFTSYDDLVAWSRLAGTVTAGEAEQLLARARQHPEEAKRIYKRATEQREIIYRIFAAVAQERDPAPADLARLSELFADAMSRACITLHDNTFIWDWTQKETTLESLLWPVIRAAAELLTSADLHLARQCAATDCTWLFLDTSKNHSRRWCDMKSCGNRTKVSKHYEKRKQK
ncbi:MAG TPA: ABATE domain-containing protein [Ktedonobacteraceae bacterium]|nr:ABATE domain-containing protein [Ktedonobacteraceae bacterium]